MLKAEDINKMGEEKYIDASAQMEGSYIKVNIHFIRTSPTNV